MNDEKFDHYLTQLGLIALKSKQLFKEHFSVLQISKNTTLFEEGKRNESEYLIISGVVRRYNITEKGDEVTTGFFSDESVVTPHFARTRNQKSIFSLQTLTDCSIAEIKVTKLDELRYAHQDFRNFGQHVIEKELSNLYFSETVYRSFSAKERLIQFRTDYPNLENLIPHTIIASYLGITNVSFSRLRNELANQ